jgi:hypothetical protein
MDMPDEAFEVLTTDELRSILGDVLRDPLTDPKRDGDWVRRAANEISRRERAVTLPSPHLHTTPPASQVGAESQSQSPSS